MGLKAPEEPKDIKKSILSIILEGEGKTNIDNLAVWYGNKLPQYLWDKWKEDLKSRGFTWQKFLKLLRYATNDIIKWAKGSLSWDELVSKITNLINGPLGKEKLEIGIKIV